MSDNLTFGVKMDGSGNLVGEAKAARDEIVNLKNATNDLAASNRSYAVTSRETAEYVMGMSIALSNAKDKAWALANGYSEVDGQLVRLNKTTQDAAAINAGATRELMVLGHEVMTGNFSRMPGTLLVLANRSGLAASGMLGMATAIAAPVVALGALAVAVHEGTKEMEAMDNALAVTSNYSGMTRGNMDSLAASMAQSGQVSIGTSREIVTQLVASGRIGAEAIGTVAQLTSNYAHATGQDISKIAPEMVKLFSDPLKGAEELNKSMHFLTAADVEHIATLQRLGQTQEAQLFLAQKVTDHLPKETENVGFLSAAYRSLKKDITDTWDAMMGLGKEMTPEAHLAKAKADMASLETKKGTGAFSPEYLAQLEKQYTIALNFYEAQVKMNAEKATAAATTTKELDDGLKIAESTRNNDSAHIKALEDERDFLEAHGVQTAAMLEREKAITREIGNIKRSMGAEARQASEAQITQQEKLGEVTLAMAAESNDTQLKLGQISKAQHDATRTALELEKNMSRQLFETQMAQVAGLTAAERQSHADKLVLLQQEALAIRQKGADALQIDEATALAEKAKAYEAINKQVTELSAHEITALDKAIAAQKLHNAEIGKTAEQKDLERAAIEAAGTAQMQTDADAIRSAANSAGEYKNIYVDRANALAHEIAQRKELAALIGEAAIKEKNVAAIKEQEKAYKDMWSTVEHTGKDVFVQVFSNGKNAFEGIGRALKASVIDLLYQMTLKKWIINVGVAATGGASSSSFAGGMGDAGSLFSAGSSLSNLFSSGSSLSNLFSSGGGMAALPGSAPIMATDVAANVAAGGSGLAAGSGIMSSLSAAAPYVAAAYMAYSLLSGSKEGPASGTGYRASGTVAASGATGSGFSLATNGSSNFADQWGVGELSAYAKLGNVDAQYKVLQGQAAQIASGLGATAASVSGMSIPFSISTGMVGAAGIGAAITQSMVDNFPQATIKALQGSAMPDYLGKFFDALVPSSLTTTDANSALQFAQQMKQVHDSLLETRSPLEVMRAQMADMAKALGTSADAYKHDFAAAIENGISQSVFTQWQQLGTAIDNVSKATTPLTQNLESSMNLFASRIEYDRLIGRIKGGSVAAPANNDELVAELRAMRAELAALRSASEKTADNTRSTAAVLDSVTGGGGPMLVQTA